MLKYLFMRKKFLFKWVAQRSQQKQCSKIIQKEYDTEKCRQDNRTVHLQFTGMTQTN